MSAPGPALWQGEIRGTVNTRRLRVAAAALAGLTAMLALAGIAQAGTAAAAGPTARRDVGGPELASRGTVVHYPRGRHPRRLPRVPCSAYVIADAGTGQVLAARDAHGLFAPASTLKVLTAITLIPRLNPNATVVASRRAAHTEPNDVGLIAGRRYRVADLFRALLTISANDAAVALSQATGGIALMNAEAHHLQAYDVVAKTPNGLPAKGQVVSAYDEALIARQALNLPAFMRYDSTLSAHFWVKPHKRVTLVNQNTLLTGYRGGIGGKIGWTVKSKATYIGLARRHGVTLITTLLHCTPLREISSGEHLLTWGFAMDGTVRPVGVLVPPLHPATPGHGGTGSRAQAGSTPASAGSAPSGSAPNPAGPLAAGAGIAVAAAAVGLGLLARRRRRAARPR